MKIRVKEYVGKKSEKMFGRVNTIPDALGLIIKSSEAWCETPLSLSASDIETTTVSLLNGYITLFVPEKYRVTFEEVKDSSFKVEFFRSYYLEDLKKEINDFISARNISEVSAQTTSCNYKKNNTYEDEVWYIATLTYKEEVE